MYYFIQCDFLKIIFNLRKCVKIMALLLIKKMNRIEKSDIELIMLIDCIYSGSLFCS